MRVASDMGLSSVWAYVQSDNERMKHICRNLGFALEMVDSNTVKASLTLD